MEGSMEILNRYAQYSILLVDDDEEICDLIRAYIGRMDSIKNMIVVHDGQSAVTKLRNQKFDLILLDMVDRKD